MSNKPCGDDFGPGQPISRILFPHGVGGDHLSRITITGNLWQPTRTSDGANNTIPGRVAPFRFRSAWSCSRWGLPGRRHYCPRRRSLTPPFHPHLFWVIKPIQAIRLSVALAIELPRPVIGRHRVLWSADFPQHGFPYCDHLVNLAL